jgi:hypothetical protein
MDGIKCEGVRFAKPQSDVFVDRSLGKGLLREGRVAHFLSMEWRRYGWVLLWLLPLFVHAEGEMDAQLLRYEGRWVGHFTIHSTATGYSETFPVEQQYWWKDGKLRGVAVSQREQGLSSSRSCSWVKDGKFFSEVKDASGEQHYWGVLHEGGIVWLPSDLKRAKDYQMKEFIVEAGGRRVLKTEGFDTFVTGEGLAHIVYRGELEFVE